MGQFIVLWRVQGGTSTSQSIERESESKTPIHQGVRFLTRGAHRSDKIKGGPIQPLGGKSGENEGTIKEKSR